MAVKMMPHKRHCDCMEYITCLKMAAICDEVSLYCENCSRYKKSSEEIETEISEIRAIDENRWYVSLDTIAASVRKRGIYYERGI